MTEATLRIKVDASDADKASRSLDSLTNSGDRADQTTSKLTDTTKRLAAAATALATSMAVREIVAYADAWQSAENQLRLVTNSTEQLTGVQSALLGVANNTRSSFESTANLYSRLSRATSEMGLSQQELIGITTTINQSFAVSGATAAEAAAAITQLSQGLAAGALRGDEFNSVSEQAPGIMRAIAESLNMTVGELRAFAAEGGITADIVVKALQRSADSIDQDFGKATATFGQSMQVAKNNMLAFVGGSDEVAAGVSFAGDAVVFLSENLDSLGMAATGAALVYATTFIPAMVAITGPIGVATAGVVALTAAFKNLQDITDTAKQNSIANNIKGGAEVITFAMYDIVQQINKARDAMDQLGGGRSAKARRAELEAEIANLTSELERYALALEESIDPAGGAGIAAEILRGKVGGLAGTIVSYGEKVKIVRDAEDAHVLAMEEYIKAQEDATQKTENARKKVGEMIGALENEAHALGMTARAAAVFEAVTRATAEEALPAEIAQIATLTARLYDMGEAKDAASEAAKKLAEDNKESARQYAEDWRRTHESLSQNIEGLIGEIESGGDAFEFLGDIAVNTAKRIAAEWLALKAMNLFGIQIPSMGGGAGAGVGSSLAGMATSAVGSSLLAGVPGSASFVGPVAPGMTAGIGGTITGIIGAIPGWGWAAMGAAALGAILNNDDGKVRSNAGMLVGPTPGAKSQYTFDVDPFASGLNVTGVARREDQSAAQQIISDFRDLHDSVYYSVKALGGSMDLSNATLSGVGEDGRPGSSGTFMGRGMSGGDLAAQSSSFVSQLVNHVEGLDASLMDAVRSASSAEEQIKLLGDAADKLALESAGAAAKTSLLAHFATEEQKVAMAMDEINKTFARFNAEVPGSIEELYSMIEAIDPLTEDGREAMKALDGLSGAISLVEKNAWAGASAKTSLLQRFATEEQKVAMAMEQINSTFAQFNAEVPSSIEELHYMIGAIDPLTESGRAAIEALDGLSGAISIVEKSAGAAATATKSLNDIKTQNAFSIFSGGLSENLLYGSTPESRAAELAMRAALVNVQNSAASISIQHHDPRFNGGDGIPAFSSGGYHNGGLAIVGERGPELVDMAPSRIYSNQDAKKMFQGSDDAINKLASEFGTMRAMMAETAAATRRTADILLRVTRDGQSLQTTAA